MINLSQAAAVRADFSDTSFNARLQGTIELLTHDPTPPDPRRELELQKASHLQRMRRHWKLGQEILERARNAMDRDRLYGVQTNEERGPYGIMNEELRAGAGPSFLPFAEQRREQLAFELATRDPGLRSSNGLLGALGSWIGKAFDGKETTLALAVELTTAIETKGYTQGDVGRTRDRNWREVEGLYEDSPRALQLAIDELSVGNFVTVVGTGGLSAVMRASSRVGAQRVGRLLQPFTGFTGFGREVAAGTGIRLGYEQTEGAPMPVRIAAGVTLGLLAASPEAVLSPTMRASQAALRSQIRRYTPRQVISGAAPIPPMLPRELPTAPPTRRGVMTLEGSATQPGEIQRIEYDDIVDRMLDVAGQSDEAVPPAHWQYAEQLQGLADPGAIARAADALPLSAISRAILSRTGITDLPRWAHQAYIGVGAAQSEFLSLAVYSRRTGLAQIKEVLGTFDRGLKVDLKNPDDIVTLMGRSIRIADHPAGGLATGVYTNPSAYDLSDHARSVLQQYDWRNSSVNEGLFKEWGIDVGEFGTGARLRPPQTRGPGFLPIVRQDIGLTSRVDELVTDMQALSDVRQGRFSTRESQGTIWTVLEDPVEGAKLLRGEPRIPVVDPATGLPTGELLPGDLTIVTNLETLMEGLDAAKGAAVGNSFWNLAVGGQRRASVNFPEQVTLPGGEIRFFPRDQARVVNSLMAEGSPLGGAAAWILAFRNGVLGGDGSLITIQGGLNWLANPLGVAAQMLHSPNRFKPWKSFTESSLMDAMLADPEGWVAFSRHMGISIGGGTPTEVQAGFLRFIKVPGTDLSLASLNEATWIALMRVMKGQFDQTTATMMRQGFEVNEAREIAQSVGRLLVPLISPRRAGLRPTQAQIERLGLVSPSFIRQPLRFAKLATQGFVKMARSGGLHPEDMLTLGDEGIGRFIPRVSRDKLLAAQLAQGLTPEEALAAQHMAQLGGSIIGLSAATAILTARSRGLTEEEAIERALTPGGTDMMRVWLGPDISIPIGGPYRGVIQNMLPDVANGEWMPFHGWRRWATGRASPPVQALVDVAELVSDPNEAQVTDFFGNDVRTEDGAAGILQMLGYFASQAAPISVGSAEESIRADDDFFEGLTNVVGEFFGQNAQRPSEFERMERARRTTALSQLRLTDAELTVNGLTQPQIDAVRSQGASTAAELREAIGTRAANAFMEANSTEFPKTLEEYNDSLELRAEQGDETAAALLIGVRTQIALEVLAEAVTVGVMVLPDGREIPNQPEYRRQRSGKIREAVFQSKQAEDVLEDLARSENEIDKFTSAWFDLWEAATTTVTKDGVEVTLETDFDLFNDLEDQFWAKTVPADIADLVEANINAAPRGANPLEVALRQVRRDLDVAEFWELEDQAWTDWWSSYKQTLDPNDDLGVKHIAAGDAATNLHEYRAAVIPLLVQAQIDSGYETDPELALINVKDSQFASITGRNVLLPDAAAPRGRTPPGLPVSPTGSSYNDFLGNLRAEWALENIELAQQAVEWDYMSRKVLDTARDELERRESESSDDSPPQGSRTPSLENQMLAQLFLQGSSYTQIAAQTDLTRGAVEQRLRTYFGGSPQAARDRSLATV